MSDHVRYPWADWWALRDFELVRGIDFKTNLVSMTQQIHNRACKDGYSVAVTVKNTRTLHVVATPHA